MFRPISQTRSFCLAAAVLLLGAGCGSNDEVVAPETGEEAANGDRTPPPRLPVEPPAARDAPPSSSEATSTAAVDNLRAGIRWFHAGEYNLAIDFLDDAIEADSNLADAFYYRAEAWLKLKLYDQALDDAARAITLEGKRPRTLVARGVAKSGQGDYAGGIAEFTRAIEVDPQCEHAYYNRGLARYRRDEYQGAIEDFDQAIDLFPDRNRVYALRAECWEALGKPQRAVDDLKVKLAAQPNSSALIIGLCDTYLELGQEDDAIALLKTSIDSVPQEEKYYELFPDRLASLYYQKGCHADDDATREQALEYLDQALKYDPEYAEAWFSRGLVNYRLKNYRQAIDDYKQAARFEPQDNFTLGNLAGLLLECPDESLRDTEQALQYAKQACAASNEADGTDLLILGKAYMANDEWLAAIPVLRKASRIGPVRNEAECDELIAECRRRLGGGDEAPNGKTVAEPE